ncbi:MAG: DUF3500 domain-containing protein [Rariglobus sp.]
MLRPTALLVVALVWVTSPLRAHPTKEAIESMAISAQAWLESLSAEQQNAALLPFSSDERENWHYVPRSREGVSLGQMNEAQRTKAGALLASGLSQPGLLQAEAVIALERVLRATEGASYRDERLYFFTVFDRPAAGGTWGWRVEGHHLSLNFTIVGGTHVVVTPQFVGANPAEVRIPDAQPGRRALAAEEDLARKLVLSLDERQRTHAIVAARAPSDILTRAQSKVQKLEPAGLSFAAMSPDQQQQFRALFAVYSDRLRRDLAESEQQKIQRTGWDHLSFAWAGGVERGQGHYYRIQGPDFVIEYDNTQNGANHIHTVWRSFDGDFGRDLLQDHYRAAHRP